MPKKVISFNQGIQVPAKIATLMLKLAEAGFAAYSQNIDTQNDEYGDGVAVPGPALTTVANNSELSGAPTRRVFFGSSALSIGYLYIAQGVLGTKTIIRRITGIITGSTPSLDSGVSMTVADGGHANIEIVNMKLRPDGAGAFSVYVACKDDTDTFVQKFDPSLVGPTLGAVASNANFTGGYTRQFLVLGANNILYWIGWNRVSSIDTSDTLVTNALANKLPFGFYASAGVDWNLQLLIAGTTDAFGDFDRRKSGGSASIVIWDYISPAYLKQIPAPCRYISAIKISPSGRAICFGGVDENKCTLLEFNGYGFTPIVSYIGDLPRSEDSVEFDSRGRICWQTVDGQFLRYDFATGVLNHLTSGSVASSAGGFLAKSIGAPEGDEFLMGYGNGSTYTAKRVQFGKYIGDDGGVDEIRTPLRVSGTEILTPGSTIASITLYLGKTLATGEKIELRIYKNGSTTDYDVYLTMQTSVDNSIAVKKETKTLSNISSYNLAIAYKQADGASTAPPAAYAIVETNETLN